MRKLSIRKRGQGAYEVGSPGRHNTGTSVMVTALDKRQALARGKAKIREAHPIV